jgi:uncharacterized protein YbjQ (UPF0145 family)
MKGDELKHGDEVTMKTLATLILLSLCATLHAQTPPEFILPENEKPSNGKVEHTLLPSGIPDAARCLCPRHVAARNGNEPNALMPSGVRMLDSLSASTQIIAAVRVTDAASKDTSENAGYKRFYALLQLKAQAKALGANALANFKQITERDSLIFTATAVKVDKP